MHKFAIVTRGRSGSQAIVEELNGHVDITCHGEAARARPLPGEFSIVPLTEFAGTEGAVSDATFEAWLQKEIFTADANTIGLKFLPHQLGRAESGLKHLAGFHIIFLQRRNVLRQAVSGMVAQKTGSWDSTDPPTADYAHELDPSDLIWRIKRNIKLTDELSAGLEAIGDSYQQAFYEDWVSDRGQFYGSILLALRASPQLPPKTTYQQMNPEPLAELLSNYSEIARELSRAHLDHFL